MLDVIEKNVMKM